MQATKTVILTVRCSKANEGREHSERVCVFIRRRSVCLIPCRPRLDNQRPDLTLRWGHGAIDTAKELAGLGRLAGCAACLSLLCCLLLVAVEKRADGRDGGWIGIAGSSFQEINPIQAPEGWECESWGQAPFPIPDAPIPIGRTRFLPLLLSLGCWAGAADLDFACPSDMQVMPALSLG